MQHPGLVSRHSPSRCSGCRQRWDCYRSQMFITATANCCHSSSTAHTTPGCFLILFTPSQPGCFRPLPAEGGCDGKQLTRNEAVVVHLNKPCSWLTYSCGHFWLVCVHSQLTDHLQPAHSTSGHRVFGYLRWTQEYMTSGHLSFQNANYSLWKKSRVEGKLCVCVIFKDLQITKITCWSASHRTELTLILFILKAKCVENPRKNLRSCNWKLMHDLQSETPLTPVVKGNS